jgi:hypothetical protein
MRLRPCPMSRLAAFVFLLSLAPVLVAAAATVPNELTAAEKKEGWRLLFDGRTTGGWRGFKQTGFPAGRWVVKDGALAHVKGAEADDHGGADIVTTDTFSEFDLRFDWRISPAGNSGLKYFVTEEREGPIAHEYQVLDDARHPDGKVGPHRQTAAFYDVLAPAADKPMRPVGEWNESRVLVRGLHVEHWLNGAKVLEYELGSPEVKAAIAKSKFKDVTGFGTRLPGHILLQDHGDEVAFRNLKILKLPPQP